jgi:hypothetical protein
MSQAESPHANPQKEHPLPSGECVAPAYARGAIAEQKGWVRGRFRKKHRARRRAYRPLSLMRTSKRHVSAARQRISRFGRCPFSLSGKADLDALFHMTDRRFGRWRWRQMPAPVALAAGDRAAAGRLRRRGAGKGGQKQKSNGQCRNRDFCHEYPHDDFAITIVLWHTCSNARLSRSEFLNDRDNDARQAGDRGSPDQGRLRCEPRAAHTSSMARARQHQGILGFNSFFVKIGYLRFISQTRLTLCLS